MVNSLLNKLERFNMSYSDRQGVGELLVILKFNDFILIKRIWNFTIKK